MFSLAFWFLAILALLLFLEHDLNYFIIEPFKYYCFHWTFTSSFTWLNLSLNICSFLLFLKGSCWLQLLTAIYAISPQSPCLQYHLLQLLLSIYYAFIWIFDQYLNPPVDCKLHEGRDYVCILLLFLLFSFCLLVFAHHFMANRRGKGGSNDRFPILGL